VNTVRTARMHYLFFKWLRTWKQSELYTSYPLGGIILHQQNIPYVYTTSLTNMINILYCFTTVNGFSFIMCDHWVIKSHYCVTNNLLWKPLKYCCARFTYSQKFYYTFLFYLKVHDGRVKHYFTLSTAQAAQGMKQV